MDPRRTHLVTFLITLLGATCCILQAIAPFRGAFQFLTVQVTFIAGAVTYARALRWRLDATQWPKARLIVRGNMVVLISVAVTLMLDAFAESQRLRAPWVGASVMILNLLTLAAFGMAAAVFRRARTQAPPRGLTPADGIDDLLTLIRWAIPIDSDRIFSWIGFLNPRRHPWGFAVGAGIAAGILFFGAHLQEGPPPNIRTGLMIAGIFIGIEFAATLLGYAALGPYLGLRPMTEPSSNDA